MRITSPPPSGHPEIVLRQLETNDSDEWFLYMKLPEVTQHTSWPVLRSPKDLASAIESYLAPEPTSPQRMAIIDRQSGRLIGTVGFHTISDINKTAEVTYDLSPAFWGRGIATAVCRSVCEWAFQTFGYVRIQATVLETNLPSEAVLKKCGFEYEGLLRSFRMVRGVPANFKMFSIVRIL